MLKYWTILVLGILYFPQAMLAQTANERYLLLEEKEIYFDFGKSEIRATDKPALDEFCQLIQQQDQPLITIEAHTDAIGTDNNNLTLSQQRAASAKAYLVAKGIPESVIRINSFGEQVPIAENLTEQGRQQNRRATLQLLQVYSPPQVPVEVYTPPPPVIKEPPVSITKEEPVTEVEVPKEVVKVPEKEIPNNSIVIEGTVKDKITLQPIRSANVIVRGKTFRDSIQTDDLGRFKTEIPRNSVISVDVYAEGYFFETKMRKVTTKAPEPMDIRLSKATIGATAEIKNLYFVGNKAVLLPKSEPELPKVLRFMKINKDLKIEIGGHINHPAVYKRAVTDWERLLSEDRAQMVADYLITFGISKDRITAKGYSNTQMINPDATTEEEMSRNRRVEIKVIQ